jgi:hypothetical protein
VKANEMLEHWSIAHDPARQAAKEKANKDSKQEGPSRERCDHLKPHSAEVRNSPPPAEVDAPVAVPGGKEVVFVFTVFHRERSRS